MELEQIIKITDGSLINDCNIQKKIKNIKIDSRNLQKNDLFIALLGKYDNGHNYVNDKLHCGAVIVDEDVYIKNIPLIKVNSTYNALIKLCQYYRKKFPIPLIAITGSTGKTTLKELIFNILSTKYKVLKNKENKNNILGIANTLFNLDTSYDMIVLEMGMNHFGELNDLSIMCQPNKAIITNIGSSHIGILGSRKNIFKAKLEIKSGLDGELIVNGDDKYLKKLKAFKCGKNCNNNLIAYNIHLYNNYLSFNIYTDQEYQVKFNIPSLSYINILLEAIKIGMDYNINMEDIINEIANFKSVNGRMNIINKNNYTIIDDCYNASYESIRCGLEYLKNIDNFKIIILGDILELGKYSKKYHKKINKLLNKVDNKLVITVGNYTKYIYGKHFNNNQDIISYLNNISLSNKYIYIKGSHGMNLSEIVNYLEDNN